MARLGKELPDKEQDGRKPFAPRCVKDVVEERLFAHRRDPLTRLDLVFMDAISLYFEGAGGQTLGQHGYSKDHRSDLRQMTLAVLIDGDGRPVSSSPSWPIAFTSRCARLRPLAPGLTARAALDRLAAVQMLDVHFPTTDGRTLILSCYTELNTEQSSWSSSSSSTYRRNRRRVSPHQESPPALQPAPCSGDLGPAPLIALSFFSQ
jgi:hypothetical protein